MASKCSQRPTSQADSAIVPIKLTMPFRWSEQRPFEIVGITAHGRVTVARLQMNHPDLVSIRRLLAALSLPWHAEV
jgi:hypothetical protein